MRIGRCLLTEVRSIAIWLRSLTGSIPTDYIDEPVLPASYDLVTGTY